MLFQEKIEILREKMAKEQISMIILPPGPSFVWIFGFTPLPDERACFACLSSEKLLLLVPGLNAEELRPQIDCPFYIWSDEDGPEEAFKRLILQISVEKGASVAIDEGMRADFLLLIQETIPEVRIVPSKSTIAHLRMLKDLSELKKLQKSAEVADTVLRKAFDTLSSNMTEEAVSFLIEKYFYEQGARPAFSLVATGRNSAFPHHSSGSSKLLKGSSIIMDIGGVFDGYYSDMTRMIFLGRPSEHYLFVHSIVEKALKSAINAITVGSTCSDIDSAARDAIEQAGYGKYFVHRTGHGLGLEIHEPPFIANSNDLVLEQGMVFTIEPGIYLPGKFGVRLEELIYLGEDGPRILSGVSRQLLVKD